MAQYKPNFQKVKLFLKLPCSVAGFPLTGDALAESEWPGGRKPTRTICVSRTVDICPLHTIKLEAVSLGSDKNDKALPKKYQWIHLKYNIRCILSALWKSSAKRERDRGPALNKVVKIVLSEKVTLEQYQRSCDGEAWGYPEEELSRQRKQESPVWQVQGWHRRA